MRRRNSAMFSPAAERMSLKAFWEAVEMRLSACSADELRAILRAASQATPPSQREAFLDQLQADRGVSAAIQKKLRQEDLLDDIDDLIQEMRELPDSDGERDEDDDRWDEYDDGGYYDDEDSLGPYETFVQPLTALFERAQAVFEHGNIALAQQAYRKLFAEALVLEDEYGRGVRPEDLAEVEVGESRARYLRAVYETEAAKTRARALFEHMQQARVWVAGPRPMLSELIEISPAPLPDQEAFLAVWIALLRKQKGAEADAWLREAIRLGQGTAGLAELARTEGKRRPRAYVDWFAALAAEGNDRKVLSEAQTALKILPGKLPIRAAIAGQLCAAATRLGEVDALRAGRWEAFAAAPTRPRLLDLWEALPEGKARTQRMRQAAQHLAAYLARPPRSVPTFEPWAEDELEELAWIDESVLAHARFLAGDLDAAQQMAAKQKVLGWSGGDNPQGLVVLGLLVVLSGQEPKSLPPNLKRLWQEMLEPSSGWDDWAEPQAEEGSERQRLERLYAEHLPKLAPSRDRQTRYLVWCLKVAKQRAEAIVGEQHRRSYGKAARLIAACAEVLRLRDQPEAAQSLVDELRQQFPRHRAFLAELDAATGRARRKR